jgi:hypothetical protein
VYWEQWNLWTLVPLSACEREGRTSLSMIRAFKANEMGTLGDVHIGTRFQLRFRLIADPSRQRTVRENGEVVFTIGGVEMYCAHRRLTGRRERSIAMWLMLYGSWEEKAMAEIVDGELVGVDITRMPHEGHGQGFELIGPLSSLFSSMYLSSTSAADRITRLGIDVVSGSLCSPMPDGYHSDELPLWGIHQMQQKPLAPEARTYFFVFGNGHPLGFNGPPKGR